MRPIVLTLLLLLAADCVFALPVPSVDIGPSGRTAFAVSQEPEQAEEAERKPGPASLEEAIEIAIKRYGGSAAGAATVERDGARVHEVRLLNDEDGSVRTVRINPETGAIIPQER
jgi:uncharacterized membrane protein YkoI